MNTLVARSGSAWLLLGLLAHNLDFMASTYIQRTRARRAHRTRALLHGTATRPRLSVARTLKHMSAQLIDDDAGKTLLGLSDTVLKKAPKESFERAAAFGKEFAARVLKETDVKEVVFDRGRFAYHGRVKAFADAAREEGLVF